MSKYLVHMVDAYTREILSIEDEVFDNEQDAEDYACECGTYFSAGEDTLVLAGESYIPREEVDFIVEEMEE